ncbi:MAG: MaoC family dehydratase N-terminal domain-containing protein [Chloroflexi bacterium]|nr:MaoC family dehydratase N-terminal domain-containing protein [Chloroflexota bacterium]
MTTGLFFEDFEIGAKYSSQGRTITESDVNTFAGLSGDFNPLHTDAEFAQTTVFGERIAHGMLTVAISTGMSNWTGIFAGTTIALMEQNIKYTGAVKFGDTVHLEMEITEKKETSKPDRGIVKIAAKMLNQKDDVVVDMLWTLMMKRHTS